MKRLTISLILVSALISACAPPMAAIQTPRISELPATASVPRTPSTPGGSTTTQPLPSSAYQMGEPVLLDLYVSPDGDDASDGSSSASPLRTLTAAWERIPADAPLTGTGYRINLLPGTYPCEPAEPDDCRNSFTGRHGTFEFPIILRALSGPGTVTLRGGLDLADISHLYLLDLALSGGTPLPTNQSGNNLLHLASADHVLLRGLSLLGPDCASDACNNLQEVLKVNQVQYLFVENSTIGGAWHSSVDLFSVQYGHFINNDIHTAGQWCMYLKGGSASLRIDGNQFHDCQLGFQAGQSSNLAVMRSPWVHYEAYDIRFINNLLHDIPGVGLSVSGGYNILFAYNTLYSVGTDAQNGYPLIQAVHGERGCTPTDEFPDALSVCRSLLEAGAWGPSFLTENLASIPNRNVFILNNLLYNPSASTLYSHLYIAPPLELPADFLNLPASLPADDHLVIAGNLVWNGPASHPLGVEDGSGCASSNPTCSLAQLLADNTINAFEPQLVDPSHGNFCPVPGGNLFTAPTLPLPTLTWDSFTPPVPAGAFPASVDFDLLGTPRTASDPPGACGG